MKNVFTAIIAFILFTCTYGFIWIMIDLSDEKVYNIDNLQMDLLISGIMGLVSALGFFLKLKIGKKG